jgi:hypothetical protein
VNHLHQQPRVTWSILTTKVNVKNTFTSHIDNKYFWHFCWFPYLYTFSLSEYAEITIDKHHPDCKPTKSALNTATYLIKQKHQQIMEHKKKTVTYDVGIFPLCIRTGRKLHVWKCMIYNCHRNITFKHIWWHDHIFVHITISLVTRRSLFLDYNKNIVCCSY